MKDSALIHPLREDEMTFIYLSLLISTPAWLQSEDSRFFVDEVTVKGNASPGRGLDRTKPNFGAMWPVA